LQKKRVPVKVYVKILTRALKRVLQRYVNLYDSQVKLSLQRGLLKPKSLKFLELLRAVAAVFRAPFEK